MKRFLCLLAVLLLLCQGAAAENEHAFLALLVFGGTQSGGDEAAFIDDEGGVYYIDMEAEGRYWDKDTLALLHALPESYRVGALNADELARFWELLNGIQTVTPTSYGVSACDAGSFTQRVYRPLPGGETQEILLLQAGDEVKENMDPSAVALSALLLDGMAFTRRLKRWSYLFPYGDAVLLSLSYRRGDKGCTLTRDGDQALLDAGDGREPIRLNDSRGFFDRNGIFTRLQQLLVEENVAAWDGAAPTGAQSEDGFSLTVRYATQTIRREGSALEEPYASACQRLEALLRQALADEKESKH